MSKAKRDPIAAEAFGELKELGKQRREAKRSLTEETKRFDKARKSLQIVKGNVKQVMKRITKRERVINGRLAA